MGLIKKNLLMLTLCLAIHQTLAQYQYSHPNSEVQSLYHEHPEQQSNYPGQIMYSYTRTTAPAPYRPPTYYSSPPAPAPAPRPTSYPVPPPNPTPYYPTPAPAPAPAPVPTSYYPAPAPSHYSTVSYHNYPQIPDSYNSHYGQFVPILRLRHQITNEENHASFSAGNGIHSSESTITRVVPSSSSSDYYYGGDIKTSLEKFGRVVYCSPEGHLVTLTYVADESGYHPKTTISSENAAICPRYYPGQRNYRK